MPASLPEVIDLLETYLELAKTQRWGGVAIVLTGHPGVAAADFAGDITLERSTHEALGLLRDRVASSIAAWTRPPVDPTLDASFVCYNVANGPLGFDFLVWLVDAEMTRVREGAPAPLKVGFWLGHDAEQRMHSDRRAMWLTNVFRPLLPMIGAVEDERAIYGRCKELYVPRDIVAAVQRGEKTPVLVSPGPVVQHEAVTITLREAAHGTGRNSLVHEWLRFARDLLDSGEDVIFVRDTAKAHEPLAGFKTDPRASTDLHHRMALYEGAKLNFFVSNGPAGLAQFGTRPAIWFMQPDDGSGDETVNTPEFWKTFNGVSWGEQWPWCRPDQRIVWQNDTYLNITAAWRRFLKEA